VGLGFELRDSYLLYHLSHTSSPFFSGYFGDGGLKKYLPGLVWNDKHPDLSLLSSQDYKHETLSEPTSGLVAQVYHSMRPYSKITKITKNKQTKKKCWRYGSSGRAPA
jgi:hypothetical protein